MEKLSKGRKVLNLFSFTGGFSLYAARGGASSVASVDISKHALAGLSRNWQLNALGDCVHDEVQADVFEWLAETREAHFNLVIVDPPSLAKRESERAGAIAAYEKLASASIRTLTPKGILVCASCSAHVTPVEFFHAVSRACSHSGRTFEQMQTTGHAPDHPARIPEAEYLKCIYLRNS